TWLAASPMISRQRSTARWSITFARYSSNATLSVMRRAVTAICRMSDKRAASERSGCIEEATRAQHFAPPEWVLQPFCLNEVHGSTEQILELLLDPNYIPERELGRRVEVDEHIHVAVGPKVVPQDRAEEPELSDVVFPAEIRQKLLVDCYLQVGAHG